MMVDGVFAFSVHERNVGGSLNRAGAIIRGVVASVFIGFEEV